MTILEHAFVGIDGALLAGLHRKYGWPIIAFAGLAATLPDWDGLTILFGPQCFAAGHRLWGHNLLVAGLLAAIVSVTINWNAVATNLQRRLASCWPIFPSPANSSDMPQQRGIKELAVWAIVGVLASYSHLLTDIVFNGNAYLSPWAVPLLWPFSDRVWAWPMVSWGDPAATLILATGMFAMLRWPKYLRAIAAISLLAVAAYAIRSA